MGKLTDYATVVLASLAQEPGRHRAAAELAERTRLSRPTVSKVLKGLQRAGMVISSRGAQGGYRLARARSRSPNAAAPPVAAASSVNAGSAAAGSESTPPSVGRSMM
jgi:DNA-binding IclR family transcriptional regulator